MFRKEMIAPCGLNCALCGQALKEENPCPGCLGPDENKPAYCSSVCKIVACEKRRRLPDVYCDGCPAYPCEQVMEKEMRYANAYPMVESPIGNLAYIRTKGMDAFLERERARWTCPACGGVVCVHTGLCAGCGRAYRVSLCDA